jgi:hypothetical protein
MKKTTKSTNGSCREQLVRAFGEPNWQGNEWVMETPNGHLVTLYLHKSPFWRCGGIDYEAYGEVCKALEIDPEDD